MQARTPFGANDIERIIVHGSKTTVEHTGWAYKPEGMTSAQLNLSYCVATLLLEGDVFVDQFTDDMVADPERMALASKVEVREDPKITALGSKLRHKVSVAVHLKDGTVLEETVEAPRGSEHNIARAEDIKAKFAKLTRRVLPQAQSERIMGLVLDVENLPDIGVLIQALAR